MRSTIFKYNKDLLELGAIETDSSLLQYFNPSERDVTLKNMKGDERTFTLDRDEKLLQGRGILGFFRRFQSDYLFIFEDEDGKHLVYENSELPKKWPQDMIENPEKFERVRLVMDSMNRFHQSGGEWLNLYERAGDFSADSGEDTLLCLPHLRDLEMYKYQERTVKAVLNRFRGRVLLCDEVGLGKTIEAGMAMLEYIMRGLVKKILILVPPSLVDQWYYELKRKFNQDFIRWDDPQFKSMGDAAWGHFDKVIASLATAKRKSNGELIADIHYDLVIVDEAHHLKNRKTLAWQFVNNLQKKYIFLLSATPVQNNLEELYNLITLLKPGQLKTYSYFKKTFIRDKEGLEVRNVDQLRYLLSNVMIRNKRNDIDIKFTKRTATTVTLSLSPSEKKLYDDISKYIKSKYDEKGSGLTRLMLKNLQEEMGSSFEAVVEPLRKLSDNDKLDSVERKVFKGFLTSVESLANQKTPDKKLLQCLDIVKQHRDKVIIFTKYLATQNAIVEFLSDHGIKTAVFNGGLRRKDKEEQIGLFKTSAEVLVSTETGGEGRNLQFCNVMINYDLPWNPMAIEQRIGRIHRIGQTRNVYVYNLAANDTVEHYILELLDKKINMFELVVGEVDMILGDIEDKADFSDLIMEAWVRSKDTDEMNEEVDKLGEKLLLNKNHYLKAKELDEKLFGDTLKTKEDGL